MPTRRTTHHDQKTAPSHTVGAPDAEDDPAEWVYPEDNDEDFALRVLASEIVENDAALTSLLLETPKGDLSTGELVRRLNAWQAMMGGGHKRSPQAAGAKPWLV